MSYSLSFSQAVMVVIFVGDKVARGSYDFVPTKILSQALHIARPTAVKILSNLSSAGIIQTREGARGGVRLAMPPAEVTILDVFNAIETGKPLFRHEFALRLTEDAPTRAQQAVLTVLTEADDAMRQRLAKTTIADLLGETGE